jgi:hypothetical protein
MAAVDLRALRTLDDVRDFIREGYRASGDPKSRWNRDSPQLAYDFEWGRLPFEVAKPGLLIERAVHLADIDGLTLQQVRDVFEMLGKERLDRGMEFARGAGLIEETWEKRPNRAGRLQRQVVLRTPGSLKRAGAPGDEPGEGS